jgi:hypothetical protein
LDSKSVRHALFSFAPERARGKRDCRNRDSISTNLVLKLAMLNDIANVLPPFDSKQPIGE